MPLRAPTVRNPVARGRPGARRQDVCSFQAMVDVLRRTYAVQLVGPDSISGAARWESPDGRLPAIGDVILIADGHARVTEIWPGDEPLIRAELL